jgi:cephalosporin hydroxylase
MIDGFLKDVLSGKWPGQQKTYLHAARLQALASQCEHITEFGTLWGSSAVIFLSTNPKRLVCYDIEKKPRISELESACPQMKFIVGDCLKVVIEPTDLLFTDTWHTYSQLKQELKLHAGKVRKYIIIHDTTFFEFKDELNLYHSEVIGRNLGVWPAVREFLQANPNWEVAERYVDECGLTVLRRFDTKVELKML